MTTKSADNTTLSGQTGTGNYVGATSPTLVTPALGTPASGTLTNCTGLPVAGGGTGVASLTTYAVICGGTTTTGSVQSIASVGTSGQVLTSNGAGALPTFQASPSSGVASITGTANQVLANSTSGSAQTGAITLTTPQDIGTSSSVSFGSIAATAGNIVCSAGNITCTSGGSISATQGSVTAGSSGNAGSLLSLPSAASNGSLRITAVNAGGAFNTTISNSTMGQSSVISIPDPGSSTATFVLNTTTISGRLIAIQTFTATGTYTPTSGMAHCIIQCIGGGGAGGGTPSVAALASASGSGGGSGGFSQSYVTSATIGASKAVTIGSGGTGSSNANGGNGGDTSVDVIVIAKGGTGGVVGTSGAFILGGSAGGISGTGDIKFPGNPGLWALNYSYVNAISGQGGNSYFGGAAKSIITSTASGISAVNNTGSGGSGSTSVNGGGSEAGGNGGSGIVIIYEYS